jgi:hypothetical protein
MTLGNLTSCSESPALKLQNISYSAIIQLTTVHLDLLVLCHSFINTMGKIVELLYYYGTIFPYVVSILGLKNS